MKPPPLLRPEAGVYDPSHRRADTASYWQWTNSGLGVRWDQAAEAVNMGWPAKGELNDRSAHWYGVIFTDPSDFWLYRVFAAGKDRFGRDERYFFVLIRLRSPKDVLGRQVGGLFSYFDGERGLPLKTEPLDNGWQDAAPDEILEAINDELVRGGHTGHWGMDAAGKMTVFSEGKTIRPEPPKPTSKHAPPPKPPAPSRTGETLKLRDGWIIVAIVVAASLLLFLKLSHKQIDIPPNLPRGTEPLPSAALPSDGKRAEDADKETGRPKADERVQSKDSDPKPELSPEETGLPNPDSMPKATDDGSTLPDQTPSQPPTEIPENQTKP
jgi:hypothetical protein